VYDILQRQAEKIEIQLEMQDLLDPGSGEPNKDGNDGKTAEERSDKGHDANKDEKAKQIEADWRNALEQAQAMVKTKQWGKMPGGMAREIGTIEEGKIDWRAYLWRYLTQTPTDFGSYDRRFVYQRAYYETISGESVRVKVAVDTSGSIEMTAVTAFLGEVKSILHAYPHLKCDLCFADTQIYGPYALTKDSELPAPEGGGGTDFRPFFEHIDQHTTPYEAQVAIYLTDGWGEFPSEAPTLPVLWVVLPGGRDLNQFPFGETVRLASAYDTAN
jgi:predicted metal-dependent peptidase